MVREWEGNFGFHPFDTMTTYCEFNYSRSSKSASSAKTSNISVVSTPYLSEILINGVLQGNRRTSLRGMSMLCRKKMWQSVVDVANLVDLQDSSWASSQLTYEDLKDHRQLAPRRKAKIDVKKMVLKGWTSNANDGSFYRF